MYLIDDVGKGDQFEYRVALASKESKDFDYFGPIQSVSNLSTNSFHEKKKLGRDSPSILGWRTDNILWQYLKQRGYEELWHSFQMHFYYISEEKVKNLLLIINREYAAGVSNGRGRVGDYLTNIG